MKAVVQCWCLLLLIACALPAQDEIQQVTFDEIPAGTTFSSSSPITMQGDVLVAGEVEASGGYRFPDGTLQTTAEGAVGSSANLGLYANRIIAFSPPLAFTEVCLKSGSVLVDIHSVGESTTGGSCVPGDLGWLIERDELSALTWASARMTCLLVGMRLPEPFELSYSCENDGVLALNSMTDNNEWASNSATTALSTSSTHGVAVPSIGGGGCERGQRSWIARSSTNGGEVLAFRCVR